MLFGVWLLAMVALIALTQPDERPDKLDTISFNTTESAEIYFRNVRAYHYSKVSEAGDIFDVYRLKSLFQEVDLPKVPLVIYHNWRSNEAFIRLDTNYINTSHPGLFIRSTDGAFSTLPFPEMDNESQYLFAANLFKAWRNGDEVGFKPFPEGADSLLITGDELKAVRSILSDYFRLTGKL